MTVVRLSAHRGVFWFKPPLALHHILLLLLLLSLLLCVLRSLLATFGRRIFRKVSGENARDLTHRGKCSVCILRHTYSSDIIAVIIVVVFLFLCCWLNRRVGVKRIRGREEFVRGEKSVVTQHVCGATFHHASVILVAFRVCQYSVA